MSRSLALRYGLALVAVVAAVLLRWLFWPVLGVELPFLFLWPAVMVSAWVGGFGPGLTTTLVGAVVVSFSAAPPRFEFGVEHGTDRAGMVVFALLGGTVSFVFARLAEAGRRVRAQSDVIAAERERLRVTLACMADAVVATDPAGRVTYLNEAAEVLTGCRAGDALDRPLGEVCRFTGPKGDARPDLAAEVLRAGQAIHLSDPVWLRSRGGTVTPVCGSAAPICPPGRDVLGVIVVFRDLAK